MARKKKTIEEAQQETVVEKVQETVEVDEITSILMQYAQFWNENCAGKSITTVENAQVLWNYWQKVSGRKDRFFGCTPCIVNKLRWMKKLCIERNIEIK